MRLVFWVCLFQPGSVGFQLWNRLYYFEFIFCSVNDIQVRGVRRPFQNIGTLFLCMNVCVDFEPCFVSLLKYDQITQFLLYQSTAPYSKMKLACPMCFWKPQATWYMVSGKKRLLLPHSPVRLFLVQIALYCWTMHSDTICGKMALQVFGGGSELCLTILIILHLCLYFFLACHFLPQQELPVAFHSLTMFLTETESWNLWDYF